jgi:hypothetical protein
MKLTLFLVASLCFFGSNAQLISKSLLVQTDFTNSSTLLEIKLIVQANNASTFIQTRIQAINTAYGRIRDELRAIATSIGVRGVALVLRINTDFNTILSILSSQINEAAMRINILAKFAAVRVKFVIEIQSEINLIRTAIDLNATGISCYNASRVELRMIFEKALNASNNASDYNMAQLNLKLNETNQKINATITRIRDEIKTKCNTDRVCIEKYVNYRTKTY